MAVMIELSGRRDAKELMARLDVAFRHGAASATT